jgi:hypothetical protein
MEERALSALFYGGPLLYRQVFSLLQQRAFTLPTSVQPSSTESLYFTDKCSAFFYRGPLQYPQVFSPLLRRPLLY